jgi:hypothetical protein
VTAEFGLAQLNEAIDTVRAGKGLKTVVVTSALAGGGAESPREARAS